MPRLRNASVLTLVVTGLVSAADGPNIPQAADAAWRKYASKMDEVSAVYWKEVAAANEDYVARLDELIKTESAKGELDRVLVLRTERQRVLDERPAERAAPPRYLLPLRAAHEGRLKTALLTFTRSARQTQSEMLTALDLVVKDETKSGRLPSAVAVRDLRRELERTSAVPTTPQGKADSNQAAKVPPAPSIRPVTPDTPKAASTAAFSWEKAIAQPAAVQVVEIDPIPLTNEGEKPAFVRVPERFAQQTATIYAVAKNQYNGVADITVQADGYLFLACNYGYQGNPGGDWTKTRWTAEQFVQNGWRKLDDKEVGGILVRTGGREQVIFVKFVRKGEQFRLRCNKYDPPFPIVFGTAK